MKRRILPGFELALGYTLAYLALIVLFPLSTIFFKSASLGFHEFWSIITSARVLAAFRISFGASLAAALVNAMFGIPVAWTLVRYRLPGAEILDAMVDLPFALPTSVAGITLTALCAGNGWI